MGRRPAFFIYLMIESVFSIATAYATSFYIWLACRIGVGFTVPAIMGTPYVMGNCHHKKLKKSFVSSSHSNIEAPLIVVNSIKNPAESK